MGYWRTNEQGHSLLCEGELTWGDSPADIMGLALKDIIAVFRRDRGRLPTQAELSAGLLFSSRTALERAARPPVNVSGAV